MKRLVLEWLISCAADDRRPLAPWIQRRVDRDPELAAFCRSLRSLERALAGKPAEADPVPRVAAARRVVAGELRSTDAAAERGEGRRLRRTIGPVAAWALAASLVAAVGVWARTPASDPGVSPVVLARQLQAVPQSVSTLWTQAVTDSSSYVSRVPTWQLPSGAEYVSPGKLVWHDLVAASVARPAQAELSSAAGEVRALAKRLGTWSNQAWRQLATPGGMDLQAEPG